MEREVVREQLFSEVFTSVRAVSTVVGFRHMMASSVAAVQKLAHGREEGVSEGGREGTPQPNGGRQSEG